MQTFLLHVNYQGREVAVRRRRGTLIFVGALVLLTVLFALAPIDDEAVWFIQRYGRSPFVLEYRLTFLVYMGVAMANVASLSLRYARITNRPTLRLGLRLVALGGLCGLGYVLSDGLSLLSIRFQVADPLPAPALVSSVCSAAALVLTIVGSTMPAWGPRAGIPAMCDWYARYRSLRRLYPLWAALYRAQPEIALLPPPSAIQDALVFRDLGFRLYRRVVEIRDGYLLLRPYFDPDAVAAATDLCAQAGLTSDTTKAVVDAASLAVALKYQACGQRPHTAAPYPVSDRGADLADEVVTLERVAHCFQHSPIVRRVLSRMASPEHRPISAAQDPAT